MELTIRELKEFQKHPVYKAYIEELREMRQNVLESSSDTSGMDFYAAVQEKFKAEGRAEVLRDMIVWVEVQISDLEAPEKAEKKELEGSTKVDIID